MKLVFKLILPLFFLVLSSCDEGAVKNKKNKTSNSETKELIMEFNQLLSLYETNENLDGTNILCKNKISKDKIIERVTQGEKKNPFVLKSLFLKFNRPLKAFVSGKLKNTVTISYDGYLSKNFFSNSIFVNDYVIWSRPIMVPSSDGEPCIDNYNINGVCRLPDQLFVSALPKYRTTSSGVFINLNQGNMILSDDIALSGFQIDRKSLHAKVIYKCLYPGKFLRGDEEAHLICKLVDADLTESYRVTYNEYQIQLSEGIANFKNLENSKGSGNKF